MIVMGNDFDLSDVHAVLIKEDKKSAVVDARFKNFGKATTVTYDLLRDKRSWMIDETPSGCYVLSERPTIINETQGGAVAAGCPADRGGKLLASPLRPSPARSHPFCLGTRHSLGAVAIPVSIEAREQTRFVKRISQLRIGAGALRSRRLWFTLGHNLLIRLCVLGCAPWNSRNWIDYGRRGRS